MECRQLICGECATEWDGINYCVRCLAKQRRRTQEHSFSAGLPLAVLATVALAWLTVQILVFVGAALASLL